VARERTAAHRRVGCHPGNVSEISFSTRATLASSISLYVFPLLP
jgi:hypothetical protein